MSRLLGLTQEEHEPPVTELSRSEYLAFISYSSVDREHALWLHRELEKYRVPKHLALLAVDSKAVSRGLRPIFFDRLELPASGNLPRSIQLALRDSKFLIVLCSPHACRSRWVNEEILTFKRMGRTDRILPLIVAGVPDARSRGASGEQECFPPALTGSLDAEGNLCETPRIEPLAADLRPEGDKRENAKLKLIAGLLEVSLDALVQREVKAARARARLAQMIANRVQRSQSLFLSNLSRRQSELGRSDLGMKLALEALPKSVAQPDRPLVHSAEDALYYAVVQHQFDRELFGSRGDLQRVLLSARGDRAVTLNDGERLTLWDLNTGEVVRSFEDVDDYVGDVAFSPRGDLIAVAVKHAAATFSYSGQPIGPPVHVMDALSGEIRTTFAMPDHKHCFVRFAPDARTLLCSSGEQTLFVHLSETCSTVFSSRSGARAVQADFDPRGGTAAIVTEEGNGLVVRFAPAASAKEILLGAAKLVTLQFNPAGNLLLGLSRRGELLLFDPASGVLRGWDGRRGKERIVAASFGADAEHIVAVTSAGTIELIVADRLDASESEVIGQGGPTKQAYFGPKGCTLLMVSEDAGAAWWDLDDRRTRQVPLPPEESVVDAAFTSDGARILIATNNGHAHLWSPHRGTRPYELVFEVQHVAAAALSSDGNRVAAGDDGGAVEMWDGTLAARVWRNEGAHQGAVTCLAFHPQSRSVVSVSGDGTGRVWHCETGERIAELIGHSEAVDFVSYAKDGEMILTAGRDGTARLWESDSGRCLKTFRVPDRFLDPIHAFNLNHHGALSEDGRHLVTVTSGDYMMVFQPGLIWNVDDAQFMHPLWHEGAIYHIALVGGDRWVLTTSYDHTARLWDLQTGRLLRTFSGHQAPVLTGVMYADGKLLATVSQDSTGRIWDVESGKQIAVLAHDGSAISLAISSDERLLATSGADGCVRIWESRTGNLLCLLQAGASRVVQGWFGSADRRFVSRAKDGRLRVWQLPPRGQALIDYARQRVEHEGGAELTREQRIRFFLESP
jgi:WD40 repeat protein